MLLDRLKFTLRTFVQLCTTGLFTYFRKFTVLEFFTRHYLPTTSTIATESSLEYSAEPATEFSKPAAMSTLNLPVHPAPAPKESVAPVSATMESTVVPAVKPTEPPIASAPIVSTISPSDAALAAAIADGYFPETAEYSSSDDLLSDIEWVGQPSTRRNPQTASSNAKPSVNTKARVDDQIVSLAHHAPKVNLEGGGAGGVSSSRELKNKDKSDRATTELVMDPKTRMILFKMSQRGIFSEVHGAVSTGKEANVYDAILYPEDLEDLEDEKARPVHKAVKIYKTSILVFKDRERYIAGEHRFAKGADKGNSHKMVKLWAEKEFRNLKRIHAAGIPSPEPVALKNNVLVMSFLGDRKGWAYPRLRDAPITTEETWQAMYVKLLSLMRTMYQVCKLVHADLSEYNVLYNQDKLYIIDVSQSVEPDHPHSLEFLRMDIKNVSDFFMRKHVETLSDRAAFDFITRVTGPTDEEEMAKQINTLITEQMYEEESGNAAEREVDNAVFRQQYIPQTLEQVIDMETDAAKIGAGKGDDLVYKNLLADRVLVEKEKQEEEEEESNDDEEDSRSDRSFEKGRPRGKKHIDKEEKKAHKLAVKEAKREKRGTKMSKYEKKKAITSTSRKNK